MYCINIAKAFKWYEFSNSDNDEENNSNDSLENDKTDFMCLKFWNTYIWIGETH